MSILPNDHKLSVVNADAEYTYEALGLSEGDQLDIAKQIKEHLNKACNMDTSAERIVFLQSIPNYLLAIVTAKLLSESMSNPGRIMASIIHGSHSSRKSSSPKSSSSSNDKAESINELRDMLKSLKKAIQASVEQDDDECSTCDSKDECDIHKEMAGK